MRRSFSLLATTLFVSMTALMAGPVLAKSKAGKSFKDSVKVGKQKLVLNGLGVREATVFKVDVYVGGLYLKEKSSDAQAILDADGPYRIHLKFVRDVEKEKMTDAWTEGFAKNGGGKGKAGLKKLNSYMTDIEDGQDMVFSYDGKSTTIKVAGKKKGKIKGADFARSLLAVWIGNKPPNKGLKKGMLGK